MLPVTRLVRSLFGIGLLAVAVGPAHAAAQGRGCAWVSPTRSVQSFTIPGQGEVFYLGGPSIRCRDGVQIQADSAVVYPSQSLSHLMGRVRFRDGGKELRADEGRYFSQQGRLQTTGNTILRDTLDGSEIINGDMVLLRQTETRAEEQITVTTGADGLRPLARLYMKASPDTVAPEARAPDPAVVVPVADSVSPDSAAVPPTPADTLAADPEAEAIPRRAAPPDTASTPYLVEGDRIFLQGDSYFLATGSVVIDRDALMAYADTAEYDQVAERMLLRGSARVEGETYDMVGRTINIALPGGEMGSVRALREAVLTGDDLRLEAPLIQLFLVDGRMERLVAVPLPGDPSAPPRTAADSADLARPIAEAENFRLVADSVDVAAPGEVLERIFAAGSARGESSARDSLNVASLPGIALKDWLEGDTVIATFSKVEPDPLLPPDTLADEYRLEELRAVGSAKSLYRMAPSDSVTRPGVDPPAVHYVTGSAILIVMVDGEVDRMEVEGPTRGWHLEPERRGQPRDSLLVPDSALVPPDTGAVRPDTVVGRGAEGGRAPGDRRDPGRDDGGTGAALPAATARERGRGRRSRR